MKHEDMNTQFLWKCEKQKQIFEINSYSLWIPFIINWKWIKTDVNNICEMNEYVLSLANNVS